MAYRLNSITCPFCYPKTFLASGRIKVRRCPYCKRTFFYWKRRYYICIKDLKYVRKEFYARLEIKIEI